MSRRTNWEDKDAKFDHREASLLLDRSRRDSLAHITAQSVEAFSYLYDDMDRANDMEAELYEKSRQEPPGSPQRPRDESYELLRREPVPVPGKRIGDPNIDWLDNILVLSPAGGAMRSKQLVQALKAAHSDERDIDAGMEIGGRGLKNRGAQTRD